MKISLIIPAYNEEKRLKPFLHSVAQYTAHHGNILKEVLVIDDGSTDQTSAIAKGFSSSIPMLHVIRLHPNQGKGAAVERGVREATGDWIVFIDADGATDITELPKMIAALEKAPVAVGNRWMKGAITERHSLLRAISGWANRTYMRLFGLGKIDTMCGFKGYHRSAAHTLFKNLLEKRWLFDTEVAYKAVRAGYPVYNFPIHWESKEGSKLSTRDLLASAWQIWPLIQRIKKQKN